jgi:hypothetical protein
MQVINLTEYRVQKMVKDKEAFFTQKYQQYKALQVLGKVNNFTSFKRWLATQGLDSICVTEYGKYVPSQDLLNTPKFEKIQASLDRINELYEKMKRGV